MIHDLSRLPFDYQRFGHYARAITDPSIFDRLGIERIDYFPMYGEGVGASHPTGHQTGGPVVALRVDDPNLRNPRADYMGHPGSWANKPRSLKAQVYKRLGAGEWTLAVDLHESVGHMIGFFIVDPNPAIRGGLVKLTGKDEAASDHHVWIPYALKAYTDLEITDIPKAKAEEFRRLIESA